MIKFLACLFTHLFIMALTMYFIVELGCWQMNVAAAVIVMLSTCAFVVLTSENPSQFVFKSNHCRFCGAQRKV